MPLRVTAVFSRARRLSEVEVAKATTFQCKPRNHETTKNGMPPRRRQGSDVTGQRRFRNELQRRLCIILAIFIPIFLRFGHGTMVPSRFRACGSCVRRSVPERCPVEDSHRDLGGREQRANELVVPERHGPGGSQHRSIPSFPRTRNSRRQVQHRRARQAGSGHEGTGAGDRRARIDPQTAAKVGKILGVKYIIVGGIDKFNIQTTRRAAVGASEWAATWRRRRRPSTCGMIDTTTAERVLSLLGRRRGEKGRRLLQAARA